MPGDFATLPFPEQIEYFRQKVNLPTNTWSDVQGEAHDHAFVIAGATKTALLEDMRAAVDKAISEGSTLQQFQADFNAIVAKHGWNYNGTPGWRARVIYETNLRQSYNAGREAQMADPELRKRKPYVMYLHSGKEHYRPLHKSWNHLVLPFDDPWWESHSPQCGWGCGCSKVAVGDDEMELLGKSGVDTPPDDGTHTYIDKATGEEMTTPNGVDPGFGHRPGAAWMQTQTPELVDGRPTKLPSAPATEPLPAPRPFPANHLLPTGWPDEKYVSEFLQEFGGGIGKPVTYHDVTDEPLMINEELFKQRRNNTWKVAKHGREQYLPLLAATIQHPDEVWVSLEWHHALAKYVTRRRYVASWLIPGHEVPGLAVFEYGREGWQGVTTFTPGDAVTSDVQRYIADMRTGVRLYRRPDDQ